MKKTGLKIFIAIVSFTALCALKAKDVNDMTKAGWLIGTWENKTTRGTVYETWNKTSETELAGKSYIIKEKDTIVFENIRLVEEKDGLVYIPVVKNQNGGVPVRFPGKTISENQLVFENPQHDFPQIISYMKITADSLVAEIAGTKNGQQHKQTFPMKRVK